MRDTASSGSAGSRSGLLHLVRKLMLAAIILLLMSPLSWALSWTFLNPVPATLFLWGALLVGVAGGNLFEGPASLRVAWVALTLGAYTALTLPTLFTNTPSRMIDALGLVAALTLTAHLGRRDLQRALRDWGLVMALSLYAALGVQAMFLLIGAFGNSGPLVFLAAALLPSILFEALPAALRRVRARSGLFVPVAALLLATLLSTAVISANFFNRNTALPWLLLFSLIVATLIGSGLLVSYLTRPLVEAASGANRFAARALVELSHGPILISLALYIPLRLLR